MTRTEEDVNRRLDEAMESYFRANRRMQNDSISDIDDLRKSLISLLIEYTNESGYIDKDKVSAVLNEVDAMEPELERSLTEAMDDTIDKTIEKAITTSVAALGAVLLSGITISATNVREIVRESLLSRAVFREVSLEDRLKRMAGSMTDSIRSTIRWGIYNGDSLTTINRSVRREVSSFEYQVRTLIMTEGNNAYRRTVGEVMAQGEGVVRAVRIIDNRGRHRNHERHECYRLAEQDMYGWGKGVYRPQDYFIYYPHPQCTAYFRIVLADGRRDI